MIDDADDRAAMRAIRIRLMLDEWLAPIVTATEIAPGSTVSGSVSG